MNNKKFTPSYTENLLNKAFSYRDKIITLRDKIVADFGLDEVDRKDCEDYYLDFQGHRPEDPENRRRYDIGAALVGLSEAWPGLEQVIECFND